MGEYVYMGDPADVLQKETIEKIVEIMNMNDTDVYRDGEIFVIKTSLYNFENNTGVGMFTTKSSFGGNIDGIFIESGLLSIIPMKTIDNKEKALSWGKVFFLSSEIDGSSTYIQKENRNGYEILQFVINGTLVREMCCESIPLR
jgi:hypothetical protein